MTKKKTPIKKSDKLRHTFYRAVTNVLQNARHKADRAVNFAMVEAY